MEFLENELGLPDSEVFQEVNRLGLNKISPKTIGDRIMDRIQLKNTSKVTSNKSNPIK